MGGGIGHFRIPQRVPNPSVAGTSPLEAGLAVFFVGRPTDQWRSNTGDAGSEMHMACTARLADATHEPAEHNDEYPYKTSYRQVSVKHMSNIAVGNIQIVASDCHGDPLDDHAYGD